MTSLARWKIATAGMAGIALFFAVRGGSGGAGMAGLVPGGGGGARPVTGSRALTLRQLRIPAHVVGLDEDAILRDLARARSTQQIAILCERLGFVGTDRCGLA